MKSPYDVVIQPVITEKSMESAADRKYIFFVAKNANKIEIADAVEKIFDVKVAKVNTMNFNGREKRVGVHRGYTPSGKKAIVTLTDDSKTIEIFEGMI